MVPSPFQPVTDRSDILLQTTEKKGDRRAQADPLSSGTGVVGSYPLAVI